MRLISFRKLRVVALVACPTLLLLACTSENPNPADVDASSSSQDVQPPLKVLEAAEKLASGNSGKLKFSKSENGFSASFPSKKYNYQAEISPQGEVSTITVKAPDGSEESGNPQQVIGGQIINRAFRLVHNAMEGGSGDQPMDLQPLRSSISMLSGFVSVEDAQLLMQDFDSAQSATLAGDTYGAAEALVSLLQKVLSKISGQISDSERSKYKVEIDTLASEISPLNNTPN
ncbi:hypothetical protein [Sphingopyxis sp. BSNA05]|uniref:hypothetical protein n=1 Tax=Sphingopyxis sp. BSNA05 TaxID=1236614 RepID=UPI0015670A28|nr:hypothetical protein [Sphingopyxis sp. BSNA05]